ncbi:MAG: proline racemase family protein [Acidimicrobiia bacterium]|nr:proline racemase family protein [Acidimicrobiia bacterium]
MHSVDPVAVVDYHTAGEPFRIVVAGAPPLEGANALERRSYAAQYADGVRQLVVNEPRGHADMYGCFVTEPDDAAADLGVVFFHKDGYSTACGHGVIALVTWAIESGRIPATGQSTRVLVDTPSGRIEATAELDGARVVAVSFVSVPSYVSARYVPLQLEQGVVAVDIAYGGAYYASVDVAELDLSIAPENVGRFVELGREIKTILGDNEAVEHPTDHRLSGLYGTIFHETVSHPGPGLYQRNLTVFADGEVDRSPCGSGTSARLALLDSSAQLARGQTLIHESVIGTRFTGKVVGDGEVGGIHGVFTEVRGSAHRTGTATFELDENDPLGLGFQLR